MTETPTAPVRVLLCDDHTPTRRSYARLLASAEDIDLVAQASSGAEALVLAAQLAPDVVLMDLRMPAMDGIEATRRLRALPRPPHVVVLTAYGQEDSVLRALRAGAAGFLFKGEDADQLLHAVKVVVDGGALLHPVATRHLLDAVLERRLTPPVERDQLLGRLSPRELDALRLIAQGLSNAEIAQRLHVGETTVKTYVSRIMTKLDRRNRVELAMLCHEQGIA